MDVAVGVVFGVAGGIVGDATVATIDGDGAVAPLLPRFGGGFCVDGTVFPQAVPIAMISTTIATDREIQLTEFFKFVLVERFVPNIFESREMLLFDPVTPLARLAYVGHIGITSTPAGVYGN